ncbi:MAG: hypothetical protein M1358_07130 [Chloroflexi bacterium]|nr:hypothetical protein [Actinomycetota bacterium]MCL5959083.1 hypothetical protein [Chloroflexota bacterium]
MVRLGLMLVVISLLGLTGVQCISGGGAARPVASPGLATAEPNKGEPTKSAPTLTSKAAAQAAFSESVGKFNDLQSYQFDVSAVLKNTVWTYKGSGAFAKPDRMQWTLEGRADVVFHVVGAAGKVFCADSRGENTRDCSFAFGGPLPGSSPYTIVAYLKNAEQVGTLDEKTIGGVPHDHVTFSPSLPKVSSLDAGHSRALSGVSSVLGEIWIDKKSRLPVRENVEVKTSSGSAEETVEMTLVFSKFNEQVDINLPR